LRNSSLQRVYFILASRDLGLDGGPPSGINKEKLNAEFIPDGKVKSNLIHAIGYGDTPRPHPRGTRLEFNEVIHIF
jgi:3-hydroxypropanoate dehydrogenase